MTNSQFEEQFSLQLNPQQTAAVQAAEGPVLLLAVPGSGKTTVLVARIGYLIHVCGVEPEQILTMTYTVSAAGDMRSRFAQLFGAELAGRLAFRTINGVCSTIIRQYERLYGRTAFELLDEPGRQAGLIGAIYREKRGEFATESVVKTIQTAITYVKNRMIRPEELEDRELDGMDFPAIYQAYNEALRQGGWMDYDDQMVYAYRILQRYPEVLRLFRRRYIHYCVDEAQDTSRIQHAILNLLAADSRSLFLVGDEDQSIYGFRAADPGALMRFEKTHPGARILLMEQNYRSTPQIVEAAGKFIAANRNRREKHMTAVCGPGNDVREISVYGRREQYRHLLRLAAERPENTAVLYRDNDSALPLIDQFQREGLPYRCRQVDSTFFTHRIVRDVTDIIRFARVPDDGEIFLRIYYKLGAGIPKAAAEEAASVCHGTGRPILEYLSELTDASPWMKKQCRSLRTHMENLLEEPADKAVYRIAHFMGYGDYLEQRGADGSKLQILEALGAQEPTPEALLDRLEALREIVRAGSSGHGEGLILSTIHSAKGLEYDRVILMDVADGLLPKCDIPGEAATPEEWETYEEERRLFYVAMTRARRELEIFRFRSPQLPSAFTDAVLPRRGKLLGKKNAKTPPAAAVDARRLAAAAKDYLPGVRIRHRTFGPGRLLRREGDIVTIQFDSGAEKRLSLTTALRMELLRLGV